MKNVARSLLVMSLVAIAQTGRANMITNPDFSDGLTGWNVYSPTLTILDSTNTNGSPYSANVQLMNNAWFGQTSNLSLVAGTTYTVSFAAKMLINNSGETVYLYNNLGAHLSAISSTGWRTETYTVVVPTSGSYEFSFLNCVKGDVSSPAAGNVLMALDHVSVEVVPEPASLALLALGGLAVLGRRRK